MCLLVFSLQTHAEYPFIFAGNRDEFHGRPAVPAQFWADRPHVLAGRDLQAGGTWLGISRDGRFATVTNYREPGERIVEARSRGDLVVDFLEGSEHAASYLTALQDRAHEYNGFNLILGTPGELFYFSNRNGEASTRDSAGRAHNPGRDEPAARPEAVGMGTPGRIHKLEAGVYGLSNEQLDTPWPKVRRAKSLFQRVLGEKGPDAEALLALLADRERPLDAELPATGLDREWERALSSIFIIGKEYGTRASSVVLVGHNGEVTFAERTFAPEGRLLGTETYQFVVDKKDE